MALPQVNGWLIDFRTAEEIFASGSNVRIGHCVQLCIQGQLRCCHCDKNSFKDVPALKAAFLVDQDRVVIPDDDILKRSLAISHTPVGSKRLQGNESAVFLTAIAASGGYGVISNHRSPIVSTVYDLCTHFGIPVYSAEEYFDLL